MIDKIAAALEDVPDLCLMHRREREAIYRALRERYAILFRSFPPISGYEPDLGREEWSGVQDCFGCPWWGPFPAKDIRGRPAWFVGCALDPGTHSYSALGDPSFCRFVEYRRILFRRFEPIGL